MTTMPRKSIHKYSTVRPSYSVSSLLEYWILFSHKDGGVSSWTPFTSFQHVCHTDSPLFFPSMSETCPFPAPFPYKSSMFIRKPNWKDISKKNAQMRGKY